jgi:D-alanyl-D-alanine carboxypeptidase
VAEPAVVAVDAYKGARLEGQAAIVFDLSTKEVLFQKNAKAQLPLASLTKLLTAYAGVTTLSPNAPVEITETALNEEGESGLALGEVFSFNDAIRLALVASSNDAAEAVAEAAALQQSTTGKNLLASAISAIGLPQTYAVNGTGLDVSTTLSGGYGSAFDVAQLAGALIEKAPTIAAATTRSSVTVRSTTGTVHTLPNTNQHAAVIPNLLLSKTGFTDLAGGNLAIVYDAGIGHPVAIVVLGSSVNGRFTDVNRLLNRANEYFAGMSTE